MNILLKVSYDGTKYHGFQIQPNLITVEEVLKNSIEKTVHHKVKLYTAGRTDRGVHAMGQCVNFYSDTTIDIGNLPKVINYNLPEDIAVVGAKYAPDDFHSRFSAKGKHYRYIIYRGKYRNPLYRNRALNFPYELDIEKMQSSLNYLIGEKNYKSFMGRDAVVKDTIRRIDKIKVIDKKEFIYIDFYGKSFLKNMIRIVVGTAIEIGRGKYEPEYMLEALNKEHRRAAGPTAPSYGLYLMEIYY
ncbi:tRNA pseudouridine38-40 synthase [Anaerosphaera aminiphila DSM 21120]|uniref:tRNA pseudouridine synthase A n=1 Tax=Anaerosphaera aminiphila DSM 21120 TaxID=1120995 RepID=A0A1M5S4M1_9FIRM|nr:tRNA pseudouridine(38-40) synthase TruA [Anaerosphaera aminiphila]SHH33395.1 tRNA pseudouridine38-40 synthase [Anaerosphaera aminiphila DSM 21120]